LPALPSVSHPAQQPKPMLTTFPYVATPNIPNNNLTSSLPTTSPQPCTSPSPMVYSNKQFILTLGDGDFSFSVSLVNQFLDDKHKDIVFPPRFVATSLDSLVEICTKYEKAGLDNIDFLTSRKVDVYHEIDATDLTRFASLTGYRQYDRIIWNFPHLGWDIFNKREAEATPDHIDKHSQLLRLFFFSVRQSNILAKGGEIHIVHKVAGPFALWDLKGQAFAGGFMLARILPFNISDFPGYQNKYGSGPTPDKSFPLSGIEKLHIFVPIEGKSETK